MKKSLWRRLTIASVFMLINVISAISNAQTHPAICIVSVVCAVICLPALITPIVMLRFLAKSDDIHFTDTKADDPLPYEKVITDERSRYAFNVQQMINAGYDISGLLHADNADPVEFHINKIRGEAVLTFGDLNTAKLARNILRVHNYTCTDIQDLCVETDKI